MLVSSSVAGPEGVQDFALKRVFKVVIMLFERRDNAFVCVSTPFERRGIVF